MTLSNIRFRQKFILKSNGMKYIKLERVGKRTKVKPVGHAITPMVSGNLLNMTFAFNCRVYEVF